jgi:hypothetical protein
VLGVSLLSVRIELNRPPKDSGAFFGSGSGSWIADMFTAARVDRYHEHLERNRPISEWVRVFKKKRDEIVNHRCPS